MRIIAKFALLPLLLATVACQPSGYYDSHGSYHSSENGYQGQNTMRVSAADDKNAVAYTFTKAGFYDSTGAYAGDNGVFGVVTSFLPPAGLCRIWSPDKPASLQAPAAPCEAKYTLRHNQYVIYGG